MSVLDLSNNNAFGNPNFRIMKENGVKGVMLKVTEGKNFVDPYFQGWARRARAQGLRVGGYHFAQPDTNRDAVEEAEHFASHLGALERRDFRPALDLESNPGNLTGDELEAWARLFNQSVKAFTGTTPMFYASTGWIASMRFTVPIGNALWLAHWSSDGKPFPPPVPPPWKKVHLHQYTSKGFQMGINGWVDKNQILVLRPLLAHPLTGLI